MAHRDYTLLRSIWDPTGSCRLFAVFVGAILFAWRPGPGQFTAAAGQSLSRHDDRPWPTRFRPPPR